MKRIYLLIAAVALLFGAYTSLAAKRYDCTVTNNTGWPTAFYLGGGDVINLQNKDSTQFDCKDLKGVSRQNIRSQGVVAYQLKALDSRTLTLHSMGSKHYAVTSNEVPYPH